MALRDREDPRRQAGNSEAKELSWIPKAEGTVMKNHPASVGAVLAIVCSLFGTSTFAQNISETVDSHLIAARTAAGSDFLGTLARLCIAPVAVPATLRDVAP